MIAAGLRIALHHAIAFENHEQTMNGALVEFDAIGELYETRITSGGGDGIEDRKCPVENLDLVGRFSLRI